MKTTIMMLMTLFFGLNSYTAFAGVPAMRAETLTCKFVGYYYGPVAGVTGNGVFLKGCSYADSTRNKLPGRISPYIGMYGNAGRQGKVGDNFNALEDVFSGLKVGSEVTIVISRITSMDPNFVEDDQPYVLSIKSDHGSYKASYPISGQFYTRNQFGFAVATFPPQGQGCEGALNKRQKDMGSFCIEPVRCGYVYM